MSTEPTSLHEALRDLCRDAEQVVTLDEFHDREMVSPPTLAVAVADIKRLLAAHPQTDGGAPVPGDSEPAPTATPTAAPPPPSDHHRKNR